MSLSLRSRLGLAVLVVATLVAAVVVPVAAPSPVAAQQQQTSWYVNDNPSLRGPSRYWYAGDAGRGYGSNNFRYTYAIGGDTSTDNWASWSMGRRVGRQEIQMYVPRSKATATVTYRINIGGVEHTRRLAQKNASGWTSLGSYDADGSTVTIVVRDTDASEHHSRNGLAASRIGVDAARMRCVNRCSSTPTTTPTTSSTPTTTPTTTATRPTNDRYSRVDDTPERGTRHWYRGDPGGGYEGSNYIYTYVRGSRNASGETIDNDITAKWEFSSVPSGRDCSVDVFIPDSRATGTVRYSIYHGDSGNLLSERNRTQNNDGDWVQLTLSSLESSVRVYASNYGGNITPKTGPDSYLRNRIAVDAARIECAISGNSTPGLPTTILNQDYPYPVLDCWNGAFRPDGYQPGQCTSYVAWRLRMNGIEFHNQWKGGCLNRGANRWGHAGEWDECAEVLGLRVDDTPAAGSVLVNNTVSFWGHAAYVERVNGDGSIDISDSNRQSNCEPRKNTNIRKGHWLWPRNEGDVRFIHFEEHANRLATYPSGT